jgi:hypothetical protein
MKTEGIRNMGRVDCLDQILDPISGQDSQQRPRSDALHGAPDDQIIFMPTQQPIWPRVWPGL